MMMAVRLAVGSNVAELRSAAVPEYAEQSLRECLAILEQSFKCHGTGYRGVVEKDGDALAGRQPLHIRPRCIERALIDVAPGGRIECAHTSRLMRRQHGEQYSTIRENLECLEVNGSFRQPDALGITTVSELEIAQPPDDLCALIR